MQSFGIKVFRQGVYRVTWPDLGVH